MSNYIMLDDKKYDVNKKQLYEIKKALGIKSYEIIGKVDVGERFKVADYEFIVLEHQNGKTVAILKELLTCSIFGSSNNYENSCADEICNKFAEDLISKLGECALKEFEIDISSQDRSYDFGTLKRKSALLTLKMYKKYEDILNENLPNFNLLKMGSWYMKELPHWWLATPSDYDILAEDADFVDVDGKEKQCDVIDETTYYVDGARLMCAFGSDWDDCGIRPFCVFSDDILVEVGL